MKAALLLFISVVSLQAADIVLLGFDEKGVLTNFVLKGDGFVISPPGTNPRLRTITISKPVSTQFAKSETFDVTEQHNIFILSSPPIDGKTTLTYLSPSGVSSPLDITLYIGKYISTFIPDTLARPGKVTVNYFTESP